MKLIKLLDDNGIGLTPEDTVKFNKLVQKCNLADFTDSDREAFKELLLQEVDFFLVKHPYSFDGQEQYLIELMTMLKLVGFEKPEEIIMDNFERILNDDKNLDGTKLSKLKLAGIFKRLFGVYGQTRFAKIVLDKNMPDGIGKGFQKD